MYHITLEEHGSSEPVFEGFYDEKADIFLTVKDLLNMGDYIKQAYEGGYLRLLKAGVPVQVKIKGDTFVERLIFLQSVLFSKKGLFLKVVRLKTQSFN